MSPPLLYKTTFIHLHPHVRMASKYPHLSYKLTPRSYNLHKLLCLHLTQTWPPLSINLHKQLQATASLHVHGIITGINVLRQNQSISQSVAQVLSSYEAQVKQEASEGKPPTKKSGRYNTTETVVPVHINTIEEHLYVADIIRQTWVPNYV